jgi:hypothetical protein
VESAAAGARFHRGAPRCPFCHDQVRPGEPSATCPECRAVLHSECWGEGGGCSSCRLAPPLRSPLDAEEVPAYARGRAPRERSEREVLLSPFDAEEVPAYASPPTLSEDARLLLHLVLYLLLFAGLAALSAGALVALLYLLSFLL